MSTLTAPESPYKGLAAFDDSELDALLFFGRERETEIIAANLQAARLTVLYGQSGVGKSSILRAGVARRLREEPDATVTIVDTWAGDAVGPLREAIDGAPPGVDVYVILDQFEEYFVYHQAGDELPRLLGSIAADARSRVNVLIGIREDALAELDEFRRSVPNLLANRLHLDLLDGRAARDAIVKPIARYNELAGEHVEIEPELVEAVLDEVSAGRVELGRAGRGRTNGRQPDRIEAPYLQLVLQTVWEAEHKRASLVLRVETLRALGGAAHIVHEHLEHAMADLTPEEKQAAAAMYNYLVTPSGTKIAHGVGDLAGYAALPESRASSVLEKLARERIVRASVEDGPASARYEIFHDVLADAVLGWRARYEEQQALHEADRRRRRAFMLATAALAGLIVVGAIAVFALLERGNARAEARRARAAALAAESLTQLGVDPPASLRLAYDAARLRPAAREESVLRTALMADRLRGVMRAGGPITAVAYDASGRFKLAASRDGRVRVYRAASSHPLHVFDQSSPVTAAAISPDGRDVAAGAEDGSVRVWDNSTGARVQAMSLAGVVRTVAFAPRRRELVAATDGAISIWRIPNLRRVAIIPIRTPHRVVKLVVSPDGRQAVAQYRFRVARVYALPTGRLLHRLTHDGFIEDAAYSPDGRLIVTGGYEGDVGGVRLWDARSGRLVRDLKGALLHVGDVTFSDDGKLVGAASADGTARVWEWRTATQIAIMIGHQNEVTSVDFNPASTALVSASSDGTARVWGAAGGQAGRILNVLAGHGAPLVAAVFSPDGESVLTGAEDGTARLWDPGSEPELRLLARASQPLVDLAVRADGRRIVVRREDGIVEERTLGGRVLARGVSFPPGGARASAVSSDRKLGACGLRDGTVQLIDRRTGRVLWARRRHALMVNSVAFSPDGKLLVSASKDHEGLVWNVETGRLLQRLHGHFGPVLDAQFSPDGRWIVTAGPITAGLWLVGSTAAPIFLDAPVARPLSSAAFAGPDGRLVVAASLDGTLRSYRCEICGSVHALVALAQQRLAAER